MQSPAPPKPWERSGCPHAQAAASTPGSTAGPSTAAQSPAAQQTSGSTTTSQPSYTTPTLSTPYGGLASRGYGGASMYGGSPYGGSPYGYGGTYGAGGLYGGGTYGGMGGMYGGGPFGAFGMHGDKDLPSGIRHIEQMLMSFGRLTQMLEMNFEVMQHFLGSLVSLVERVRAMYSDARQLTSTVGRQSLEFGESSISTARQAKSRLRRHPHDSNAKPSLTPSLTRTLNPHPHPHPHPNTLTRRHPLGSLALVCFALTLLLRRAWQRKRRLPPVPLPLEGVWSG